MTYNNEHHLEHITEIENDIQLRQKHWENTANKVRNQHRLYNYWEEKPMIRIIPTLLMYISGKLIRKL